MVAILRKPTVCVDTERLRKLTEGNAELRKEIDDLKIMLRDKDTELSMARMQIAELKETIEKLHIELTVEHRLAETYVEGWALDPTLKQERVYDTQDDACIIIDERMPGESDPDAE